VEPTGPTILVEERLRLTATTLDHGIPCLAYAVEETVRWLAGDEGCEWLLRSVDGIVEALGGSTFAGANARELKL